MNAAETISYRVEHLTRLVNDARDELSASRYWATLAWADDPGGHTYADADAAVTEAYEACEAELQACEAAVREVYLTPSMGAT